ncbi:ATP-dependent zinc metalloprotease FtsH [Anaerotruncus colihominis]|uniref:ATP-dependent zinc metalloprotease FtsH n=3 Tax=Oscillospiraceae TaxID=216572 RepID=A0A845RIT3_9FIRM|nr:ATP-dependent zinc metalloprotease FtsH [Anaerotruncus sp.]NBI78848.1 ATP-dependent zinc metalloprotease FtsH [Anaerotruncus colihominis]NDO39416.1 ATP-dependent zinc metalloprotease FtsH [Anaerotruncus colihominis]
MNKKTKGVGIWLSMFLLLMLMAVLLFSSMKQPTSTEKYSDVLGYFQRQEVKSFVFDLGTGDLEMTFTDGKTKAYRVPNVNLFINDVYAERYDGSDNYIQQYNKAHPDAPMQYDLLPIKTTPWWVSLIPTLVLVGLLVFFYFMMMKQARGGGTSGVMGFGKAKPRQPEEMPKVTFNDVAGADEEKEELVEIVEFLKNPSKFNSLGARIPKGVLLMGPPGTGKTLLAKAVAGEAGVPFFSISGSDFVEMFVGVGASRVRDLFEQAKKNSPSIIFIDEIDAVGRHRGAGLGGGHDEREQTLNQLLVEMDGFGTNSGVIVIAATNRRDILDPALLRPGRFDRQIAVGYPDIKGREAILRVHTKNKPIAPDVNLKTIAASTAGFTGADLENLTNEAALLAAKKNHKAITMVEIEEATIKVIAGPEKKSHVVTEKDKKLTSYHEAGHAVCTYYLPTQDPVHQISIVPRGMAGGYTLSLPSEDKTYVTKREMNEDIVTLLGGRVAEKLVLDDISTGASNDIERATKVARNMVVRYGFSEKLGPIVYGHDDNEVFLGRDFSSTPSYSETVAAEIDTEIREIIDTAYERAVDILTEHMGQLHEVAKYLFDNEKMDEKTFADMMAGKSAIHLEKSADSTEQDSAQTAVSMEEAADEVGQDPTV